MTGPGDEHSGGASQNLGNCIGAGGGDVVNGSFSWMRQTGPGLEGLVRAKASRVPSEARELADARQPKSKNEVKAKRSLELVLCAPLLNS